MSKSKLILVLIAIVVVIAGILYFTSGKKVGGQSSVDGTPVATVNGVPITKSTFDTQLAMALTTYKNQGVDVTNADKLAEIKKQVLTDFINNELLAQGAIQAKVSVTPDEVEKQYQTIQTQIGGADKLKAQLSAVNLTDTDLRANIAKQLVIQKYLRQNIDVKSVTVSDAEISKFYADNTKGQTNVPTLKQVSDQIKQQLLGQKQQALVAAFIESLKSKAQITTSSL